MPILGIYPSHDSGAALVDLDGNILAAVNEGRLVGEKLYWGFPTESVREVLDIAGFDPGEVDHVAFGGRNPAIGKQRELDETPPKKRLMELLAYLPYTGSRPFARAGRELFAVLRDDDDFKRRVRENGIEAPLTFYDHHRCHAASAYYTSPFDEDALVLTLDAQGDFVSSAVYTVGDDHELVRESWTPFYHSPGKYWVYITSNLGFTPLRHEGKIAGLAAHGDASESIETFRRYMGVDTDSLAFVSRIGRWNYPAAEQLHDDLRGTKHEDIAAGLQQRTEEVVSELVEESMRRFGCSKLALAGGVFANVGLNRTLLDLDVVSDLFVHPHMSDGGLAVGAANVHREQASSGTRSAPRPSFIGDVYFGTAHGNDDIEQVLDDSGVAYATPADPEERIAELLAEGYVVGRYDGQLEYGPRALGNRSILAAPTDPTCQDWLNERLDRTEFMPFAPTVLEDHVDDYYRDTSSGRYAGRFMTITFEATDRCRQVAPAVVHVDGTSRPQIVGADDNPEYHHVLESYRKLTGIPLVVNTSFNAHGEPIVNSPESAIRAYQAGIVDALAIGDYVLGAKNRGPSIEPKTLNEMVERPRKSAI